MSAEAIESVFTADEIRQRVQALGAALAAEFADQDPLFLGISGGSVLFLADLVRALGVPARFEFVPVKYHHPEIAAAEIMDIHYPLPIDISRQQIVVVKDVVSSGVPETYLAAALRERGAAGVRFVALVDMPEERKTDLEVAHYAFSVHRTGGLVGYGLKHEGRYGNLPFIGRIGGRIGDSPAAASSASDVAESGS